MTITDDSSIQFALEEARRVQGRSQLIDKLARLLEQTAETVDELTSANMELNSINASLRNELDCPVCGAKLTAVDGTLCIPA